MSTQSNGYEQPVELLQNLIRFDTTNPPGNEAACIAYVDGLISAAGIETTILARDPNRPNLIARLKGRGEAPPLLLYGHVDVVTTAGQDWEHPPFAADIADGYIWGRGTLDMKGAVAMMLSAFLRAKAENTDLPGDVILAVLADEENMSNYGAKWLVEEHPEVFEGVQYALGEFGGFTLYIGGKRFYPIMVAEKQECWMKATFRGPGGHGSMPIQGGAMAKLGRFLTLVDRRKLPVHITPTVRAMISHLADELAFPTSLVLRQLLNPALTDTMLKLMGAQGHLFDSLLHNTISPTELVGSQKLNVIPGEVSVSLDGRLLPGYTADDMLGELNALVGEDLEIEVVSYNNGASRVDMSLFDTLAGILKESDPDGIPLPYMLGAVTDGRFLSRLGIQTYGFTPMQLDPDFSFTSVVHAANERIPVEAVNFGSNAVFKALQRFGAV